MLLQRNEFQLVTFIEPFQKSIRYVENIALFFDLPMFLELTE